MKDNQKFTLTEDHIKLLRAANVGWEDCEFGAPAIDCKRPYGNSSVYQDIAEILGVAASDNKDGSFTNAQYADMLRLHKDTCTALQIVLAVGYMKAATYEADKYDRNWREVV